MTFTVPTESFIILLHPTGATSWLLDKGHPDKGYEW